MNNPAAAVGIAAGVFWLAAIVERLIGWIGWSWWLVMSPPLVIVAAFVLYVLLALAVNGFYTVLAWRMEWRVRREKARQEKERRRIREFFARGMHLQDRRNTHDWPQH